MPANPTFTFPSPARSAIPGLVAKHSPNLHLPGTGVDGERLLLAICGRESSFGRLAGLRVEPAYSPGGNYFKDSPFLKAAFGVFGKAACGSWGPFQILYSTAYECGFRGLPWELFTAAGSLPWVVAELNRIIATVPTGTPEAKFIENLADGFNTGSWRKGTPPEEYIKVVLGHYQKPLSELRAAFA